MVHPFKIPYSCIKNFNLYRGIGINKPQNIIWIILLISFVLKILYVFYFTDYPNYLFSDCAGYWDRALERLGGNIKSINQWGVWPAFYHIILTEILRIIRLLGLFKYKLEIVLALNVIFSTISVYLLYRICCSITNKVLPAILVAGFYAFYYPFIYFNAFILSENLAVFLFILSIYILFEFERKTPLLFLSGMTLGVSTAIRPAYGVIGIIFFLYLILAERLSKKLYLRTLAFVAGFFILTSSVIAQNIYLSDGKLVGIGPNGGVTFYFAQCKSFGLESKADGYAYYFYPPATVVYPENGIFKTNHPIYDQKYFFQRGIDCIKKNPNIWVENLTKIKNLFFSPLMPSAGSATGFRQLYPLSRIILFFMFVSMGFVYLAFKNKDNDRRKLWFLISIPVLSIITHYFFNYEQRYVYSFAFPAIILFFIILYEMIKNSKIHRKDIILYILVLSAIFGSYYGSRCYNRIIMKKNIKAVIVQNKDSIKNLYQKRKPENYKTIYANILNFWAGGTLEHPVLGNLGYNHDFFVDFEFNFDTFKDGLYEFHAISDDGVGLVIDGRKVSEFLGYRSFDDSKSTIFLKKGHHSGKMAYFQGYANLGVKARYRRLNDSNSRLYYIGEDSEFLKFNPYKK